MAQDTCLDSTCAPTVLLVEDDTDIREALEFMLTAGGYYVASATHGRQALDLLEDGLRPSVILLDLMMPVMDGVAFRKAQLQSSDYGHIPVVLISGAPGLCQKARELRADGCCRKPFDIPQLLDVVGRFE